MVSLETVTQTFPFFLLSRLTFNSINDKLWGGGAGVHQVGVPLALETMYKSITRAAASFKDHR